MASKLKSNLTLALKIAFAAGLIAYMVRSGHLDPKNLWELITPFNVAVTLALVGLNILLSAWRWIILMQARGLDVGVGYGFSLFLIGIFFNHALPGSVGGDVVRGYYVASDFPGRRADTVMSVLIDRMLGLYSFFILTLIAVAWDFEFVATHEKIRWVALFAAIVFVGVTLVFLVAFSRRLSNLFGMRLIERHIPLLHKLIEAFQRFGANKRALTVSILVSMLAQIATMTFFYWAAGATGEPDVTWKAVMFAVPMGFLVTAVPLAPAGIGVGQVAFAYLFQAYLQKTTPFGATAITAFQLATVAWALVGAFLYLRRRKPRELAE